MISTAMYQNNIIDMSDIDELQISGGPYILYAYIYYTQNSKYTFGIVQSLNLIQKKNTYKSTSQHNLFC